MFRSGIIIGYRITDPNTERKEVILAMRFNAWEDLDEDTRHNISQLGRYFQKVANTHNQVLTNGAWDRSGRRKSHNCTGLIST
jgi:hypothetical protein